MKIQVLGSFVIGLFILSSCQKEDNATPENKFSVDAVAEEKDDVGQWDLQRSDSTSTFIAPLSSPYSAPSSKPMRTEKPVKEKKSNSGK